MRKVIVALLSTTFAVVTSAQELFQCANSDVVNGLVFNGRLDTKFSMRRGMPADREGFEAPATFLLIGTAGYAQYPAKEFVGYRVDAPAIGAIEEWIRFLGNQGWQREPQPMVPPRAAAAQAAAGRQAASLCRNGERRDLLVQEVDGTFYATISAHEANPPRACGMPEVIPANADAMAWMGGSRTIMPQFTFPASARKSGERPSGSSGDDHMISEFTRIESPDSDAKLLETLGKQLTSQGWSSDADWKGVRSVGSTWKRQVGKGRPYLGTLQVLSLGENLHEISFTVAL